MGGSFVRGFFAKPLVSETPDGFGLKCEHTFASQNAFSEIAPSKSKGTPRGVPFDCGGGSGIRTHVGVSPNGFQDRLVMTTSISLQVD